MSEKIYNNKDLILTKYWNDVDKPFLMPSPLKFQINYESGIIWINALIDFYIYNSDVNNAHTITCDAILHPFDIIPVSGLPNNCPTFNILNAVSIPAASYKYVFGFGFISVIQWGQICDHVIFNLTNTGNLYLEAGSIFKVLSVGGNCINSQFI